mmetsp:Transcript_18505/g.26046  ORF Transcript_18505/g.26046 Transcript_18505/m.26046 type:complete len:129 (-) Transcript_18505:455-841(-)
MAQRQSRRINNLPPPSPPTNMPKKLSSTPHTTKVHPSHVPGGTKSPSTSHTPTVQLPPSLPPSPVNAKAAIAKQNTNERVSSSLLSINDRVTTLEDKLTKKIKKLTTKISTLSTNISHTTDLETYIHN